MPLSVRLALCLLLSIPIGAAVAQADGTLDDIVELEARFSAAIKAGGEGMESLLHERFFYNTVNGTSVDKSSLIDSLRQQKAMVADLLRRCVRIDLHRDSAVVTAVSNATFTMENREMQLVSRYLHLWLRTDGQWQLFARQVTASNVDSCE